MKITPEIIQILLGRPKPNPNFVVRALIEDQSVLVTGAGGSIGSELCMQLLAMYPRILVLYDSSEYALYTIEQRLRESTTSPATRIIPVLGNLTSSLQLERLLRVYSVSRVYHAAAYKHVPMVERNPVIGIQNNLYCTRNLVQAAKKCDVEELVLVSTDKAVNPTNVLGATKRLAEYVTLGQGYRVVRFGNVLWSTGSVLPLFYRQLTGGKPVTITHKEVSRYFMSISEAVSLILESGLIEGSICVLDMGEPVKIEELAKRLAHILKVDYEIEYIGLRAGEKLHEELTLGQGLEISKHPLIFVAEEPYPNSELIGVWMEELDQLCEAHDLGAIRLWLQDKVPGYRPSCGIVDDMWLEEHVYAFRNILDDCFRSASPEF